MARIAVISDSHTRSMSGTSPELLKALAEADWVVHCGDYTSLATLRELRAEVQACRERATSEPNEVPAAPVVAERGPNPVGVAFLGAAGAATVAAIVYDITLADERSLLDDLRSECRDGFCNIELAREVAETVDEGKVVLAVFTGIAVATGITGLVLLLTGDDEDQPETVVSPVLSPQFAGAVLEVRY